MKHIVVDLEINRLGRKERLSESFQGELIEIGAVMLDDDMNEISEYKTYVHPEHTDRIAPRIKKLTGITEENTMDAPVFYDAFESFCKWCLEPGDEITMYEWSTADRNHFVNECTYKEIELSPAQSRILDAVWIDIQEVFDNKAGYDRQMSLNVALFATGLMVEGELHDALDDARNTGRILAMLKDEALLKEALDKINSYINPPPLTASIGSMFDFSGIVFNDDDES